MTISREELLHVARLARLHVQDADVPALLRDLSRMLEYVESLGPLPEQSLDELVPAVALADDEPRPCLPRDVVLAQAPRSTEEFFRVPGALPPP